MTGKCVGVSWVYGNFGPAGEAQGSECLLNWEMVDNSYPSNGDDSARLQNQVAELPTVIPV
jgi:hypothetical protein